MLLPSGEYHLSAISEPGFYVNNSIIVNVVAGYTTIQDIELLKKKQVILAEVYPENKSVNDLRFMRLAPPSPY